MSKKVLVIDDPKTCRYCPACGHMKENCKAVRRMFADSAQPLIMHSDNYKPTWCPLKDLPEYKMDWSSEQSYESGWNDVLDLIGGDE